MKKLAYAAALVALASVGTSAFAASDGLRLYGLFEVGPEYNRITYKGQKHDSFGMGTGAERFGLTGTHAISSDLNARFTLEAGFSSANGMGTAGRLFGRQASVGLVHKHLGSVDFGRHYNFGALYEGDVDPFGGGYGLAGGDTVLGNGPRMDNLALYQTPNLGGWQGGIGYSFGVDDNTRAAENELIAARTGDRNFFGTKKYDRLLTAGIKYGAGPLAVVATFDRAMRRQDALNAHEGRQINAYMLGAAYDISPFTLYAAFSQTFGGWIASKNMNYMPEQNSGFRDYQFAKGFAATTGLIGAQVTSGVHRFMASWQQAKPRNTRLTGQARTFDMYSLGYRYALSKRTALLAFVAYGTNYAFIDGLNGTQTSMRVQHRF